MNIPTSLIRSHEKKMRENPDYVRKIEWAISGGLETGLTTPAEITNEILNFCKVISDGNEPIRINVKAPLWSRKACCEMNSRKLADELEGGGELTYGYKIWSNGVYAMAEPHCVLQTPDGILIDPTFNADSEEVILFVKKTKMTSTQIKDLSERPCVALDPDFELCVLLKRIEDAKTGLSFPSEEKAWAQEITYADHLKLLAK